MSKVGLSVLLLCAALISAGSVDYIGRISFDSSLIVPGIGAEKAVLGSDLNEFLKRTRRAKYKVSRPGKPGEVFADIFRISIDIKIYFDEIYMNEETGSVVYIFNKKITAVSGLSSSRITSDQVDIRTGMENFIFNYGNTGVVKIENRVSRVYVYKPQGIAVFDDGRNDTIDLYLIFSAAGGR